MNLIVGQIASLKGYVTTLGSIAVSSPLELAARLGFFPGKMARGYWICVMKDELRPGDFEYAGTTLRSGGKMGVPALTQREDANRVRVHDALVKAYGATGYERAQKADLQARIRPFGIHRIVKIITVVPHMQYASPAKQYPQGSPALQLTILDGHEKAFLVAAFVDAQGMATTPQFSAQIGPGGTDEARHKLRRYLEVV